MQMPGLVREINSAIIVCGANLLVSCSVGCSLRPIRCVETG